MNITGGMRRRLIKDNLYYMIYDALRDLGWFDGQLSTEPVTLLAEQINTATEIKPNKVGISAEDLNSTGIELGSNLDEYKWNIYIDVFTEDESVGTHLSGDIYDILTGKMASIGRTGPSFPVKDLTQDEEEYLFTCNIQDVEIGRIREYDKPYLKYWWVVACDLTDTYYGE